MSAQGLKDVIASANAVFDTISVHETLMMVRDDNAVFVNVREAGSITATE